jgi:RND family efflux transporter MFP subunit
MDKRLRKPTAEARNRPWVSWRLAAVSAVAAAAAALGCQADAQSSGKQPEPQVQVAALVPGQVTDNDVFTGRIQTMHFVTIQARVTGHLQQIHFKEGEDVKAGDPLFDIDSRLYDAALKLAEGQVEQAKAHRDTAMDAWTRDQASPGANSAATIKQDEGAYREALAALNVAQAAQESAQINVNYCHIKADFSGRISRLNVDLNNDIIADNTILASLVQLQPKMYAYFDVDERSLLDLMVGKKDEASKLGPAFLPQGKVPASAATNLHLTLGLANEDPLHFSHPGDLFITDNKLDATTGTIRMWGTFANEKEDLEPNMFARVKVDVGPPHEALFVAEAALGSDQGFRYVYVVNEKNEVEYTRVEPGQKQDGRVAVAAAPGYTKLTKDTQVVVDGLQSIHPVLDANGKPQPVKVAATVVDMPKVKTDEDQASADKGPGMQKKE